MKKNQIIFLILLLLLLAGCKKTTIPATPSGLQAVLDGETQILLTWRDSSIHETEFRVYRGVNTENCTELISKVGAGVTSYKDTHIQPGRTYYYIVKAYNPAGESAASNKVLITVPVVIPVPTAPTNLKATALSSSEIKLTWQDQSDNEDKFIIYRGTSNTNITEVAATLNEDQTTFTDTGLTDDTTYYYIVKAENVKGVSAASNIVQGKTIALKATLTAKVVDQYGEGLPGVSITMGSLKATTDAAGSFIFSELEPGNYTVKGIGGQDHHYILGETQIHLVKGNQSLDFTAYQILGAGVVIQSYSNNRVSTTKRIGLKKEIDLFSVRKSTSTRFTRQQIQQTSTKSLNMAENVSFIALSWGPIEGCTAYEVMYLDNGQWTPVWSSDGFHPEDPQFYLAKPEAYLDLGNELAGLIMGAGQYTFKIVATVSTTSVALPQITVSLGVRLADFPSNLMYTNSQLTWSGVAGASQYRTLIYDSADLLVDQTIHVAGTTSMSVPAGLTPGEYYQWHVDAQALDETGWLAEITRSISGFTL